MLPRLAAGVQGHVHEAVHGQAEALEDPPDGLLTLPHTFWAHEKAFTHVAANFSHGRHLCTFKVLSNSGRATSDHVSSSAGATR